MKKIAIIGAGMSGLSAAQALRDRAEVTIFDKSRGVGGRMSTRYAGEYEFDHGAQYFTVKSPEFRSVVNTAMSEGHVMPWASRAKYLKDGEIVDDTGGARFVATPRMNSWTKVLATDLNVELGRRVTSMKQGRDNKWSLGFEAGAGATGFDRVICSVPPVQALDILPKNFSQRSDIKNAKMDVCFALMIGLNAPLNLDWDSLRLNNLPIGWMAINSDKPNRGPSPTLMIHSAPEWSNVHADADRDWIQNLLLNVGSELVGHDLHLAPHKALHRWLYASVQTGAGHNALYDEGLNIAVCGDWCVGGRVEGAFLSGLSAAQKMSLS